MEAIDNMEAIALSLISVLKYVYVIVYWQI